MTIAQLYTLVTDRISTTGQRLTTGVGMRQVLNSMIEFMNDNGTLDNAYDFGGAGAGREIDAVDGAVKISGEDGLLVTGTFGSGADAEISGAGTRMFFNPKKAAFRAGQVAGSEWDDANIGNGSFASGSENMASGQNSTAMGYQSVASGGSSVSIGSGNNASNIGAVAIGGSNAASGINSVSIGKDNTASGDLSCALGDDNTSSANASFSVNKSNVASGAGSFASGFTTEASGFVSFTNGEGTKAESYAETALGSFNTDYTPTSTSAWSGTDRLLVIGNGQSSGTRADALIIQKNGNITMPTTTGAFSPPILTTTQRNALTPTAGMMIYNSTDNKHQGYDGTSWNNLY